MSDLPTEASVLRQTVSELEAKGYDVYVQPNHPIRPEFLDKFVPDIIALKGPIIHSPFSCGAARVTVRNPTLREKVFQFFPRMRRKKNARAVDDPLKDSFFRHIFMTLEVVRQQRRLAWYRS